MAFTGHEDNSIEFEDGAILTKEYRTSVDKEDVKANYYSKDSIQALLNQDGSIGIRAYFGKKADGQLCLVIVGVDETGNDQIGTGFICVDSGDQCPPICSTPNILNS